MKNILSWLHREFLPAYEIELYPAHFIIIIIFYDFMQCYPKANNGGSRFRSRNKHGISAGT